MKHFAPPLWGLMIATRKTRCEPQVSTTSCKTGGTNRQLDSLTTSKRRAVKRQESAAAADLVLHDIDRDAILAVLVVKLIALDHLSQTYARRLETWHSPSRHY